MQEKTILLDGMRCGHCVAGVRKALGSLDAVMVKDVKVGSATLELDETRVTSDQISAAVGNAGYSVRQFVDLPSRS